MWLEEINWKKPDYLPIAKARWKMVEQIRASPSTLADIKLYYRQNVADFIEDFGVTYDPRAIEVGRSAVVPFILFPKQREFVDWVVRHWHEQTPGLAEKSRDGGISWLCVGIGCALCVLYDGMAIGYGSRKEEYVDKTDNPKSLFWKARFFMRHLPQEFRAGWRETVDAPYMRLKFPETGSFMGGEAGDDIGRGDRTGIFFIDEAAHLARPMLVDAALSQTTNCRIDVSSVNGMNNSFAVRRHSGKVDVFTWDWRDDPRKDQAWYDKQVAELDPVVVAQEIDRDYSASVEGVVIPAAWVRSAIDADVKLGLGPTGKHSMSLDVADEGVDKNAALGRYGIKIDFLEEWSGKGSDIFGTVQRAFGICDEQGYEGFRYDADGLGAGVRGDSRIINDQRRLNGGRMLKVEGFRGSDAVFNPEGIVDGTIGIGLDKGRLNKDYFANRKAQGWWSIRKRFQKTHRWVVEGVACKADEIISISSKMPLYLRLMSELSQPTYSVNGVGKLVIDKKPDGMKSPNLADCAMIEFAENESGPPEITQEMIAQVVRGAGQFGRHGRGNPRPWRR
jgi:hypothetical protein